MQIQNDPKMRASKSAINYRLDKKTILFSTNSWNIDGEDKQRCVFGVFGLKTNLICTFSNP